MKAHYHLWDWLDGDGAFCINPGHFDTPGHPNADQDKHRFLLRRYERLALIRRLEEQQS